MSDMTPASARADEIARFDALAAEWWDPAGPMRPLHAMNPARIGWIMRRIRAWHPHPAGLRLLDVGCGAGLAAEALAREGLDVLGIDAAPGPIAAARAHAEGPGGDRGFMLAYRVGGVEDLVAEGARFPLVTALEVIEHVAAPSAFVAQLAELLAPGGLLFLSTLNRTAKSFVTAKLGAEYVLGLLPVGTHDWRRFLTPAELGGHLRAAGLRVSAITGLNADPRRPVSGPWRADGPTDVNYLLLAEKNSA